jgi:hypothetical protein
MVLAIAIPIDGSFREFVSDLAELTAKKVLREAA